MPLEKNMNHFAEAAIRRGNTWTCQSCGSSFPAVSLDWTDMTPMCPKCGTQDMLIEIHPDAVVVTRHPALVALLVEKGLVPEGTPVIDHATPEDVAGKHVYGVLPLSLAAKAALVTEIPLKLTLEQRGKELTLDELRQCAGTPTTYRVEEV